MVAIVGLISNFSGWTFQFDSGEEGKDLSGKASEWLKITENKERKKGESPSEIKKENTESTSKKSKKKRQQKAKIKELAEKLKNLGVYSSIKEATDKAKDIILQGECDPNWAYGKIVEYIQENPNNLDFQDLTEEEEEMVKKDLLDILGDKCEDIIYSPLDDDV